MANAAVPCTWPEGCGRTTKDASTRCVDHRGIEPQRGVATGKTAAVAPVPSADVRVAYLPRSSWFQGTLKAMEACRDSHIPAILWGEPGTGKTSLIEALAAKNNMPLEVVVGSQMDPTDVQGLPMGQRREDGTLVTERGMPDWAQRFFDEGTGVLFFDEASNTPRATQAAILTLLQSRTVQGRKLPDDVWIVAAANPTESAADGWDLAAPTANRLAHLEWNPPAEDWYDGMLVNWGNPSTDREAQERSTVVAFVRAYPQLLQDRPDDEVKAGRAWPSRRSWDNTARVLSKVDDPNVRLTLTSALVGDAAAVQMATWERSLDLPSASDVMAEPSSVNWADSSADRVYAILGSVVGVAGRDTESFEQACEVFGTAAVEGAPDVAAALVPSLFSTVPKGASFPMGLVEQFGDQLKAAGIV